ncbi:MAG: hypothetical protein ACI814_003249 [Mariniblastus sp.]
MFQILNTSIFEKLGAGISGAKSKCAMPAEKHTQRWPSRIKKHAALKHAALKVGSEKGSVHAG